MNQKGFVAVIFIPIILLIILGIAGGSFYYIANNKSNTVPPTNNEATKSTPTSVATELLKAIQSKNKELARNLLSPTANKNAFVSTLSASNSGLYARDFTFEITEESIDKNDEKHATVYINIITMDQEILPGRIMLVQDQNENWQAEDLMVISPNSPYLNKEMTAEQFKAATASENEYPVWFTFCHTKPSKECSDYLKKTNSRKLAIRTYDPIRIMLVDPNGNKIGYDPISKKEYSNPPTSMYYPTNGGEAIFASNNTNGQYKIIITGLKDGEFKIINEQEINSLRTSEEYKSAIKANEQIQLLLNIDDTSTAKLKLQ